LEAFRESVRAGFADPLLGNTVETARQYALALGACSGVARLYANEGFRCVIDDAVFPDRRTGTNSSTLQLQPELFDPPLPTFSDWQAALPEFNPLLVVLLPRLECVLERSAKREGRSNIEPQMLRVIHELMQRWRLSSAEVIDNSDLTVEETVERLNALLRH
jgi:hypothetical protein